jgi:hypothetical protein
MSRRYILNSAVITAFGEYAYERSSAEKIRKMLEYDGWISCIGDPETATALQEITGQKIPLNRQTITMHPGHPGDEAIVFRLVFPQGYRPDPAQKGNMGKEFILKNCEIGILRMLR